MQDIIKKVLFSLTLLLFIIILSPNVIAKNNIYYVNENNVEMTEQEYNDLLEIFSEDSINIMDQEQFEYEVSMKFKIINKEEKFEKVDIQYVTIEKS